MADVQKYKEEDGPSQSCETTNKAEVMFFTNRQQVYKCRLSEFDDSKASLLGDYLPSKEKGGIEDQRPRLRGIQGQLPVLRQVQEGRQGALVAVGARQLPAVGGGGVGITNLPRYRCRSIPAAGALLKEEDGEQMRLM